MPSLLPDTGKPRLTTAQLLSRLRNQRIDFNKYPLIIVGIRGYYKDSMGAPGVNDRGIYDDAIFVYTSSVMAAFNGNTDPSRYKKGRGTGTGKGMATLVPGAWFVHRFDMHNGKYLALCQRLGKVEVIRDGNPPYRDIGNFGINIHKGSYTGTSSLGCQTIHPDQWDSFIHLIMDQAKRYYGSEWKKKCIPYILFED